MRVLAHRAVEDQEGLVRGTGKPAPTTLTTLRSSSIRPSWVCKSSGGVPR
jgi:hypothetical protein